jgi:hypothetical protein
MADQDDSTFRHGARRLAAVTVETYNAELRDSEGFIGDRASKRAFTSLLESWRERIRQVGDDPLGETPTSELKKKELDQLLVKGDPEAAGLLHGVIEAFAQELAAVIRKFLRLKEWRETRTIVVGGGLRASRIGELAIGRAAILLKGDGHDLELKPIRHHPDEAGLIGCAQLVPSWVLAGHDGILAVDIGAPASALVWLNSNSRKPPICRRRTSWHSTSGGTATTSRRAMRLSSALPIC